jgi:hypothetical protein
MSAAHLTRARFAAGRLSYGVDVSPRPIMRVDLARAGPWRWSVSDRIGGLAHGALRRRCMSACGSSCDGARPPG